MNFLHNLHCSLLVVKSPKAVNQEESRSLVFALPKISVVPMLDGSFKIDFDNSVSSGIFAPPPTKTIPAGNNSDLFIFFKLFSIDSKISHKRASIISSSFFLEKSSVIFPSFNSSAFSSGILNPRAMSLVMFEEPTKKYL